MAESKIIFISDRTAVDEKVGRIIGFWLRRQFVNIRLVKNHIYPIPCKGNTIILKFNSSAFLLILFRCF